MFKKIDKKVINDGKVVMVELTVEETSSDLGFYYTATGRATCDLSVDKFDVRIGEKIAEDRAYQKAIKKSLKHHKSEFEYYTRMAKKEKEIVDLISKKLK